MSVGLAPFFRRFELPWSLERGERAQVQEAAAHPADHRDVARDPDRRCCRSAQTERMKPEELRERVAQLIVEKPKPPPPPPPPEPEKEAGARKAQAHRQKPVEKPKPNVRNQGMLALADELADLRDQNLDLQDPQLKTPVEDARSERNLITSQAGRASAAASTPPTCRAASAAARAPSARIPRRRSSTAPGLDPNAGGQRAAHRQQRQGLARARGSGDRVRPQQGRVVRAVRPRAARSARTAGQAGARIHHRADGRDHHVPRGVERAQRSRAREEDRGARAPDPLQGRRTSNR